MADLEAIFARHASDKGTLHSYLPVYERLLAPLRQTADVVLEIGVLNGDSLRAWREYFPHAQIVGIDHGENLTVDHVAGCSIWLVDANKPEELAKLDKPLAAVIDDGNHHPYSQMVAWGCLWPRIVSGGVYAIEDVRDIEAAADMCALFGGHLEDLRHVKGRWDDVMVWFGK